MQCGAETYGFHVATAAAKDGIVKLGVALHKQMGVATVASQAAGIDFAMADATLEDNLAIGAEGSQRAYPILRHENPFRNPVIVIVVNRSVVLVGIVAVAAAIDVQHLSANQNYPRRAAYGSADVVAAKNVDTRMVTALDDD